MTRFTLIAAILVSLATAAISLADEPGYLPLRTFRLANKRPTCFALTENGTFLVGSRGSDPAGNPAAPSASMSPGEMLLVGLRGDVLRGRPLGFEPQAICSAPNDIYYVAGAGCLIQVDSGMIVKLKALTPPARGLNAAERELLLSLAPPKSADARDWQAKRAAVLTRMTVLSAAAGSQDVFLACATDNSSSCDVWRMDRGMDSPRKIVGGLPRAKVSGLDAWGDYLFVVAADREVVCFDRDGKRVRSWKSSPRPTTANETTDAQEPSPSPRLRFGLLCYDQPSRTAAGWHLDLSPDAHEGYCLDVTGGEFRVLADSLATPTHLQSRAFPVPVPGDPGDLRTFCTDRRGNLLLACESGDDAGKILVLSPEGKLLATWEVGVVPQSLGAADDGTVYVGGQGRVAKLSPDGRTLGTADAPQLTADAASQSKPRPPPSDAPPEETRSAKIARLTKDARTQLDTVQASRQAVEAAAEKGDLNAGLASRERLDAASAAHTKTVEQLRFLLGATEPNEAARRHTADRRRMVCGIAASGGDVFFSCPNDDNRGFEIWRTDRDFGHPLCIVTGLAGTVNQMDIQAAGADLLVADNCRYRVLRYDRDGRLLAAFGSRAPSRLAGFGPGYSPMNVLAAPDGSVYTAEPALGRIKRYSAGGGLLGVVALASPPPIAVRSPLAVVGDGQTVYWLDLGRTRVIAFEKRSSANP